MIGELRSPEEYISQFDAAIQLSAAPRIHDAPAQFCEPGLRAVFFESVPYQGRATRCFAWIGIPEGADKDHPVPGIVLVHGGGGTALANWVRHWNSLGYAAISMDTCGAVPCWSSTPGWHPAWPRHEYSGAPGWGGFDRIDLPVRDQWVYQAAAAVLRGTAVLKSMPEVQPDRIGIAGISWGGFLTLVASSVAPQGTFRFAMPVYASSRFTDHSTSTVDPDRISAEQAARWTQLWDPAPALPGCTVPTLFLTDAEDIAFALPSWQRTTELPDRRLVKRSLRIHYTHDHETSMRSRTEAAFAEAVLNGRKLPEWGNVEISGKNIRAALEMNGRRAVSCELCYTRAEGFWADRNWRSLPVKLHDAAAETELPRHTTAAFFSVTDDYGCIWTSPVYIRA